MRDGAISRGYRELRRRRFEFSCLISLVSVPRQTPRARRRRAYRRLGKATDNLYGSAVVFHFRPTRETLPQVRQQLRAMALHCRRRRELGVIYGDPSTSGSSLHTGNLSREGRDPHDLFGCTPIRVDAVSIEGSGFLDEGSRNTPCSALPPACGWVACVNGDGSDLIRCESISKLQLSERNYGWW